MVTCFDGLLPIKSHDRYHEITGKLKTKVPMVAKLGRVMAYLEGLQTIKSFNDVLITWFGKVNWQTKNITTRVPLATKLGRMVTYLVGLLRVRSHDPLITSRGPARSRDKLQALYLQYNSAYMFIKLGRMVSYLDGLLPIKSLDLLMTSPCKIVWRTKNVSPIPQCP